MKTGLKILLVSLVVLIAGTAGAWMWLSQPVALQTYDDGLAPVEQRQRNSDIETALLAVGIESSLIDIDDERAYLAYDMPADAELGTDEMQIYILSILAGLAPESALAYIVQFVDEEPALTWEADLAGARAVAAGTADEAAYLATVVKTTL